MTQRRSAGPFRPPAADPGPPAAGPAETPPSASPSPVRIADARNAIRHVFIRDLVLCCRIGVHRHEEAAAQRVRINLDLSVRDDRDLADDIAKVVCYEQLSHGVRRIVARRHIRLVETLAEEIAQMCLKDGRIRSVRVRVEKLDALADAGSVGVEIERYPAHD